MYVVKSNSPLHSSFQDGIAPSFETHEECAECAQELTKKWDAEWGTCPEFYASEFED